MNKARRARKKFNKLQGNTKWSRGALRRFRRIQIMELELAPAYLMKRFV